MSRLASPNVGRVCRYFAVFADSSHLFVSSVKGSELNTTCREHYNPYDSGLMMNWLSTVTNNELDVTISA